MKTYLVILASVLLIAGIIGVVFAAEQNVPSTVTVNSFASVTITPCAGTLSFGSGNPGAVDLPVACQNATDGAVKVKNELVSNKDIDVTTKGTNFTSGGDIINVNKIEYDENYAKSSPNVLSESYQPGFAYVTPGSTVGFWYWLDIPGQQAAGTYSGTLSVKGE